jgi:hypothetical protein
MTRSEAKQWVQRYFRHFNEWQSDELYMVVEALYGCFDPLPKCIQEDYTAAATYHELWLEVRTDLVIENIDDPRQWMPQLYPLYIKDQAARGGPPASKDGFSQWLGAIVRDDDVELAMQSWPPA